MADPTDALVEEGLERLSEYTEEDARFEREFGRWKRPGHLPRYPLQSWLRLLHYRDLPGDPDGKIIEAEAFRQLFPKYERPLIGQIVQFVYREMADGKRAGDKTLNKFRFQLQRRLEELGY